MIFVLCRKVAFMANRILSGAPKRENAGTPGGCLSVALSFWPRANSSSLSSARPQTRSLIRRSVRPEHCPQVNGSRFSSGPCDRNEPTDEENSCRQQNHRSRVNNTGTTVNTFSQNASWSRSFKLFIMTSSIVAGMSAAVDKQRKMYRASLPPTSNRAFAPWSSSSEQAGT